MELATRHQLETVPTYNLSYRPFHIPQHKSCETNDSSDRTAASRHHSVFLTCYHTYLCTWHTLTSTDCTLSASLHGSLSSFFSSFLRLFFWLRPCPQFSCVLTVFRSAATGSSSLLLGPFTSSPLRVFGISLAVASSHRRCRSRDDAHRKQLYKFLTWRHFSSFSAGWARKYASRRLETLCRQTTVESLV